MKRFFIAAALAAMLPTSFAMAEDAVMAPAMMMENLTTIQNLAQTALKENDIDVDVMTLKNSQLAEIVGALNMAGSGDMAAGDLKGALQAAVDRK